MLEEGTGIKLCAKTASEWMDTARATAVHLSEYARAVDEEGAFPEHSMQLLREAGLMGISVPSQYGGAELPLAQLVEIGKVIAGACLSTGMIWAMHIQQVAIIAAYAEERVRERLLPLIVAGKVYVVSATSDQGGSGGQITTQFVLSDHGEDDVYLERHAPTVTGAAYGDVYVIIMKENEQQSKLSFVIAERHQIDIEVTPSWQSMGMRGTQSCELLIKGSVPRDQVIVSEAYDVICNETMNPIGHLLWASCWLGAVQGEYRKWMKVIRTPKYRHRYKLDSDLLAHEIGRLRLKLDMVDAYLTDFTAYYKNYLDSATGFSNTYKIKVNNLKIIASEVLNEVMDQLVQLGGVKLGYLKNEATSIEKVYRDIRSSRLMISNDHLKVINGKLSILERY